MEIWKAVKGYEGLYEVSNLGRVRSLPKYNCKEIRILKTTINKKHGRCSVLLCKDTKTRKRVSVHRLVAIAFVENPNPQKYTEINHKDENPLNNKADNLEWCDRWYNMHYNNLKERIARPQKKRIIAKNKNELLKFESLAEANKKGFCGRVISKIINHPNQRKQGNYYKGYFWEIAND